MRGLGAVTCREGRLDLQGLYTSADARCPPGFRTHIWYGQQEVDVSSPDLHIEDGAVITAAFLPAQPQGTTGEHGPPDDGFGSPHNNAPPDQDPDGGTNTGPGHAPAAPPSPDAGTGSSCSSSPCDAPAHFQIAASIHSPVSDGLCGRLTSRPPTGYWDQDNMCRLAFTSHHALPEGKQARTSVAPVPRWHLGLVCCLCRLHESYTFLLSCLASQRFCAACAYTSLFAAGLAIRLAVWAVRLIARGFGRPAFVCLALGHFAILSEGMQLAAIRDAPSSCGPALPDAFPAYLQCADGSLPTFTHTSALLTQGGNAPASAWCQP